MKKYSVIKSISAFFFFILTILSFFVVMFLMFEYRKIPNITRESLLDSLSSRIYDKNNNLIATIGNERREFVEYENIPESVRDAVLSVEDTRFNTHIGLDPKRIIKALVVNLSAGSSVEGGSTITQQVVKTSLLTSKKTYDRKIQEALLSLKLESKYTKEDILEMYLNKIFYSDHRYGIRSASKYFYAKELDELTVPQVALLAGIPQQPVAYNPYDNPEAAKYRRDTVLYAMYNNGKLKVEEYNNYIQTPVDEGLVPRTLEERKLQSIYNAKHGAYIDAVVKEIQSSRLSEDEQDPFSLGLHIYTNLNPDLQEYVQNMLDNQSAPMIPHASQSAITVLDTTNGLIEAIGGGKGYKYGGFNFATDSKLQPGSAIKPIFDYVPGIEYYGWDSATKFLDSPYLIAGTNHYILNWDRLYHGNVSMRTALAMSYNVPAVRAFEKVGYERSKYLAAKLGIELKNEVPTSAIGGSEDTVSPIAMAGAYATFGNNGIYNKPSGIIKVLDSQGNELTNIKQEPKKALSDSTAFIITDILKDVLTSSGTSPRAAVAGMDMAAKSGSSTFDEGLALRYGIDVVNATKDSWLVGYTKKYTVSVWQGADSVDSASKALSNLNTQATQLIFADIMRKAHGTEMPPKFEMPESVEQKGGVYVAKERNTETDNMYSGTALDAVYQSRLAENERNNRIIASTIRNVTPIVPAQNNNTIMNNRNNSVNNRQTTNNNRRQAVNNNNNNNRR